MIKYKNLKVLVVDLLCVSPIYDRYLCEALRVKGADASLSSITFHLDPALLHTPKIVRSGWVVDIVARLRLPWASLRRGLKLLEYMLNMLLQFLYCTTHKFTLVHVQWLPLLEYSRVDLIWLRILKFFGKPLVLTVHNVLPHDTGNSCFVNYRLAYETVDGLIVHTELSKKILVEKFGIEGSKISLIPMGPFLHDFPRFGKKYARALLSIPENAEVILFLGTCKPYKGLEFLLESWPEVAINNPNALLIIAGNGESCYLQHIRKCVRSAKIDGSVRLDLRGLSNSEIVSYHEAVDVLVLPYAAITQSGALLTAMAFGKTIVATDIPGFGETIENDVSALLVPFGDSSTLSHALLRVLKEPKLRERLGQQVLYRVEHDFNWELIADRTIASYENVIYYRSN